jgi:drug/metabolite transporter (DMT)-like permease
LDSAASRHEDARRGIAVAALLAGAAAIGSSALFVKVSETGPVATAFWRVALALPVLWAWSVIASRGGHVSGFEAERRLIIAAGLFFAGDLAVWHWSIVLTSVANATLLANLAPIFVALAVWLLWGKRPSAMFVVGLAAALAGVTILLGGDFRSGGSAVLGDLLGVVTALFYGAYQLTVTRARARSTTAVIMAWSALVTTVALLPVALASGEQILPHTAAGWVKLAGLALISQVAGQSLIAYAMAHLPATFSSVGLLAQPVIAAILAWILLGETLGWVEIGGALVVLVGIRIVHQAELGRRDTANASQQAR